MTKEKEFIEKLKNLLREYNAEIDWTCSPCSDLHGVYNEAMRISINKKEILRVPYQSYIQAEDL